MTNPYLGVNAHLNSLLQAPSSANQPALWPSFHLLLIAALVERLNPVLPSGYIAVGEQSLQIRDGDDVTNSKMYNAVLVREVGPQSRLGRVVLRIEVLSPSNKPGGSHATAYRLGRLDALRSGIPLVEIDILHESRSPLRTLPVYPQDTHSTPYYIAVSDPNPTVEDGRVGVYGFSIGTACPVVKLPLSDAASIDFETDPVYQLAYQRGGYAALVDLTAIPERFDTYSATDQTQIRGVMAAQ